MLRRLIRSQGAQALIARLLGAYLAFTFRTIRWRLEGEDLVDRFVRSAAPIVIAFWHERLPLMPMLWILTRRRVPEGVPYRPHILVSRHRDGRMIGDLVARFGFSMVYGSSTRGGVAGMRALLDALARRNPVAITPDGPRGPRRVAVGGAAQLAALAGCTLAATAASVSRARVLGTWDRTMIPLPFGRGVVVVHALTEVAPDGVEAATAWLEAALTAACARADRLVGR